MLTHCVSWLQFLLPCPLRRGNPKHSIAVTLNAGYPSFADRLSWRYLGGNNISK